MTSNAGSPLDTFPKLVRDNAERLPAKSPSARRTSASGSPTPGGDYLEQAPAHRARPGLAGVRARATRPPIIGRQPPAALLGDAGHPGAGRACPSRSTRTPSRRSWTYIVDHAEARFAIVEDQEQVDKLLQRPGAVPAARVHRLRRRARAPRTTRSRACEPGRAGQERGEKFALRPPGYFERRGGAGAAARTPRSSATRRERPAQPKGAMLSYRNLIETGPQRRRSARGCGPTDEVARVPADGVGRRPHVLLRPVDRRRLHDQLPGERRRRCCTTSRRSGRPTSSRRRASGRASSPRAMIRIEDAAWPKRGMVRFFLDLAQTGRAAPARRPAGAAAGRACSTRWAACSSTARCATTSACGAIRLAYTAGEAIGPELFEFYPGARHQREAALRDDRVERADLHPAGRRRAARHRRDAAARTSRSGSSDSGEVLYRSPGVFAGYYKNPEATRQTLEDGWVHSGDAGLPRQGRPPQDHRPGQGRRAARRRARCSRPSTSRTS